MTAQHLSTESLSVLLEKGESVLSAGDRAHLADCPACHEEIAALREVIDELGRSEQETEIELTELVQDRLARLHALDRRLEAEIHRAKNLVATKRTAAAIREVLDRSPDEGTPGLVRVLIDRSEFERGEAPAEALEIARLAVRAAAALRPDPIGPGLVDHLLGLAEKELANVLRVVGFHSSGHCTWQDCWRWCF